MDLPRALGVELPVIQAPMAGVQDSALAIAVCGGGWPRLLAMRDARRGGDPARDRRHPRRESERRRSTSISSAISRRSPILAAKRSGAAPSRRTTASSASTSTRCPRVAAGFRSTPPRPSSIEELRPPVVSFHFGLPDEPLLGRVRATGARILASATTVAEGLWLEQRGVDAVIAQGLEAGGHRGHFLRPRPQPAMRHLRARAAAGRGAAHAGHRRRRHRRPRRRRGGAAPRRGDGPGRNGVPVLPGSDDEPDPSRGAR